jgi:predicted AlkP superfamily phosphohydrolase/phosphomutase
VPGNRYENAIHDYYRYVDGEIGRLLERLDDDTVVLVVSDHGAKPMVGGICINEWLIQNGYLVLKERPEGMVPLEKVEVDWGKTRAWAAGGYYARISLNVRGREPEGIIPPEDYEKVRDELAEAIAAITDENGVNIGSVALKPQEVYRTVRNIPPDLIVYLGDLSWRAVGSVGLDRIYTYENDTGPDDANHAQEGLFILYDPKASAGGREAEGLGQRRARHRHGGGPGHPGRGPHHPGPDGAARAAGYGGEGDRVKRPGYLKACSQKT